jgi:ADP-heptose:LPS heptosyltransferase
VGVDSMPMHIAQIFDVPGVIFFGSVSPQYRLYKNKIHSMIAQNLDCLGCHHKQKAPAIGTHDCMRGDLACETEVSVDQMWQKIQDVLRGKSLPIIK